MRSSSRSNNNNRSSILALFLDAPTTDALLTLPSVRPATRPWEHCSRPRRPSLLPPPTTQATTRRRQTCERAMETRSRAQMAVRDNCGADVVARRRRRAHGSRRRLQLRGWPRRWPPPWRGCPRRPRGGQDVAACRAVRCYGTLRSQKYKIMGWLHHKMLQMGVFSTHLEQR